MFENQKLLVIAPHPDDEVLGCGGLITRVKESGGKVFVMILAVGDQPQYGSESKAEVRINEVQDVMKFLKVDDYEVAWIDNEKHLKLDMVSQKDLIDFIEIKSKVAINKIKPDIVAIPHPNYNQDHRAVFEAAFTACRPRPIGDKPFQKIVISYEDASQNWAIKKFDPNFYVDITQFIDKKCDALKLYKSQIHPDPHYISIEVVQNLARLRGVEVGVKFAEAFHVHRFFID